MNPKEVKFLLDKKLFDNLSPKEKRLVIENKRKIVGIILLLTEDKTISYQQTMEIIEKINDLTYKLIWQTMDQAFVIAFRELNIAKNKNALTIMEYKVRSLFPDLVANPDNNQWIALLPHYFDTNTVKSRAAERNLFSNQTDPLTFKQHLLESLILSIRKTTNITQDDLMEQIIQGTENIVRNFCKKKLNLYVS